jgi:hypothetical protein
MREDDGLLLYAAHGCLFKIPPGVHLRSLDDEGTIPVARLPQTVERLVLCGTKHERRRYASRH